MSRRNQTWIFAAVAIAALMAGLLLHPGSRERTAIAPDSQARSGLLEATLPDLAGRAQRLDQWRGKVVVVNFWATWCLPCRDEIPAFIRAQQKLAPQGVQIVGIAIDQLDKVKPFASEMGINYPVLIGELDAMDLTREAGNRLGGLPFTVLLDRSGKLVSSELGGITEEKLDQLVRPLL